MGFELDEERGVVDDNGKSVSALDDDYEFWKHECDRSSNPLDDDYVRNLN